ncbi:MAG: porin [Croceibacterium sp.]
MRGKFSTLSGVALVALAIAGVATPTMAQAKSKGAGTVTLTAEQWQAIQSELAELHQDVNQLKAEQQATQSQAVQAQTQATQAQTQATQAAAAATQAQTAANDAKTVAKTASADAVKPFAGLKDTTISGRMYFNASEITREVNGSKTESDGGFLIKRFYLGVDHKFNNVLSGNITTDVDSVGSTNGSLVGKGLYIKKAYLQAKFSPAFAVRLGTADLPWIPYVEGIYGYRYVENTLTDRTKFGTSADWGVHTLGDLAGGIISYDFAVVDGGGYRDPKFTNTVDFEGRVSAKYKGFNVAVGGYTGKLGKNIDGGAAVHHTATRFDALVAYKDTRFTLGGEYFAAKNWTQINALPSDKADGWSVFGSANVVPKISVFGRYDWVKPHKDTLPNLKDQYFNAGVQYEAFKNVDFSLVYKHDKAENGTISTSNGTIGGSTNGTYDEIGVWGVFQF